LRSRCDEPLDEDTAAAIVDPAGVPASTVKTRMFNARRRMEGLLKTAGLDLH
jgi:DNA-directed RNA polymerase specialized sigma24 family protein